MTAKFLTALLSFTLLLLIVPAVSAAPQLWIGLNNGDYAIYDGVSLQTGLDPGSGSGGLSLGTYNGEVYAKAIGGSTLRKYDGSSWSDVDTLTLGGGSPLQFVSYGGLLYIFGNDCSYSTYDGAVLTNGLDVPDVECQGEVRAVGTYAGLLYIGTGSGNIGKQIWSFNGAAWSSEGNVFGATNNPVSGFAEYDGKLYAVGAFGNLASYDGVSWSSVSTPCGTGSVSGIGVLDTLLFITTEEQQACYYDGVSWSSPLTISGQPYNYPQPYPGSSTLYTINSALALGVLSFDGTISEWNATVFSLDTLGFSSTGLNYGNNFLNLDAYSMTLYDANVPPVMSQATMDFNEVAPGSSFLFISVNATDADNDDVTYHYVLEKDGVPVAEYTDPSGVPEGVLQYWYYSEVFTGYGNYTLFVDANDTTGSGIASSVLQTSYIDGPPIINDLVINESGGFVYIFVNATDETQNIQYGFDFYVNGSLVDTLDPDPLYYQEGEFIGAWTEPYQGSGIYTVSMWAYDPAKGPVVNATLNTMPPPVCGNNVTEPPEECDGSAPEGYTCSGSCALVPFTPPPPDPSQQDAAALGSVIGVLAIALLVGLLYGFVPTEYRANVLKWMLPLLAIVVVVMLIALL